MYLDDFEDLLKKSDGEKIGLLQRNDRLKHVIFTTRIRSSVA